MTCRAIFLFIVLFFTSFVYGASSGYEFEYSDHDKLDIQDILFKGQNGDSQSQYELGYIFLKGDIEYVDYIESLKWLCLAVSKNHPRATTLLSQYYRFGWGDVEIDLIKSKNYLSKASSLGDPEAKYLLGVYYYRGVGVERNIAEAKKYFYEGVLIGNPMSMYSYSIILLEESTNKASINEAMELLETSGFNGVVNAFDDLSIIYEEGIYVERDIDKAEYYKRLYIFADQGVRTLEKVDD